jgi:superfamily I DNA/RNA helicase
MTIKWRPATSWCLLQEVATRAHGKSAWSEGDNLGNLQLTWDPQPGETGRIQVTTIHSFKGLERPVVILTELDHLYSGREAELLYVARSRASSHLVEVWKEGPCIGIIHAPQAYSRLLTVGGEKESGRASAAEMR